MTDIPDDVMMNAERLYDEGGYKTVPEIIAEAILAERERCARIADRNDMSPWGIAREIRSVDK